MKPPCGVAGAVHFFDRGAQAGGRVEDLDRVVCGVGDVEVAGGGGEVRDGDAVGFFEAAEADRFDRRVFGFDRRFVLGDVGAVGDVEVARGRVDGEAGGLGGVDHGAGAGGEGFGVFDHVAVPVVDVEVAFGVEGELAGAVAGVLVGDRSRADDRVVVVVGDVEAAGAEGDAAGVFVAAVGSR